MNHLWSVDALIEATGGRPLGTMPDSVGGISIDTRTLAPGDAFFAIKGESLDGHDFAGAALAAGAGVLVVDENKLPALGRVGGAKILVPDVLKALEAVGVAARARSKAKIIAITGSAGKTSTKEAMRHALSAVGKVHASDKSFNNHWGVPLTLSRLPEDADFAIFEIGMNHPGEIRPLTKMVRPHVALITLIAAAHLGHFRDLDEIAAAKAEIFEGVVPKGVALLNHDDARFKLLSKLAHAAGVETVKGFGEHEKSDFKLLKCEGDADGSLIVARVGGRNIEARVGAPGRHVAQNALAVLATAELIGADVDKVAAALATLVPESGRGRRHDLMLPDGTVHLIDESYNANPASMKAALDLLCAAPLKASGRRIAVLGDMLELGTHAEALHAGLADLIDAKRIDEVLLAGPEMKALAARLVDHGPKVEYRSNVEELKPVLMKTVRAGDAVMIKSSKGIGFSKLVEALTKAYPAKAIGAKRA